MNERMREESRAEHQICEPRKQINISSAAAAAALSLAKLSMIDTVSEV